MGTPKTRAEAAELLGLPLEAEEAAVRERYRRLAQIYHPDRNPDAPAADTRMQELNAAYDLLLGSHPRSSSRQEKAGRATAAAPRRRRPADEKEARIREAMHELPYGVYVIGSVRDGEPNGMIADWVMQISFEPRLVAVAFERDAYSLESIRQSCVFTVNLLPEEGMELAGRFLQPRDGAKVKGRSAAAAERTHTKLTGVDYRRSARGCPILSEALGWFECEAERLLDVGDHTLVVARVLDGAVEGEGEPLTSLYSGWTYSG